MSEAAVPIPWPESGERAHTRARATDVPSAISSLRTYGEAVHGQGLAGAQRRLRGLSPEGRLALDALVTRIVAEFLHLPTLRLQEAAAGPEGVVYARAVHDLFAAGEDGR